MNAEMKAEAIELMLMDGDPSGRWTAELLNWPGKAYKIPRTQIKECFDVPELQCPGVYFLLGQTDWNDTPRVYIGEAENVAKRLKDHLNAGKEFWNEVITFTSDNHLNKAHIKYMEHHLHKMAKEAGRYEIENGGTPTESTLSNYEKTYANKFMACIKIVIGVFGHHLFESLKQENSESTQQNAKLTFKMGKVNATGCRHPEGFLVFSGSTMNETSKVKKINNLREKYQDKYSTDTWTTSEDILFHSPSAAAEFLCGYGTSGPEVWKDNNNRALKDIEKDEAK